MQVKKRGKGRITNGKTIRDMYKFYKKNYTDAVSYKVFATIIKACNKELLNQIVNHSESIALPYRLGYLQVCKFKRSYNQPKNKWAIDWKKTRELGFKVYHDQKYIYRWCWKKHYSIVRNKTGYKFEASRMAKRMVPKAVARKVDYFR